MSPTRRRSVRPRAPSLASPLLALLLALGSASTLAAQAEPSADTATARALFSEGVSLADEARWPEAAERFERVLAIRWSSAAALNLAAALAELGRLLDASELYRKVSGDESAAPEMRTEAESTLAELALRLGRLHVRVTGDSREVELYVDGRPLPQAAWGAAIAVDPGTHAVMALRGGETLASRNAIVGDGAPLSVEVVLELPAAAAPSPATVAAAYASDEGPPHTTARTDDSGSLTDQWWFWSGAGVIAATAITVVLIAALSSGRSAPTTPVAGTLAPGVLAGQVEEIP